MYFRVHFRVYERGNSAFEHHQRYSVLSHNWVVVLLVVIHRLFIFAYQVNLVLCIIGNIFMTIE